jgi:hypothetical protein
MARTSPSVAAVFLFLLVGCGGGGGSSVTRGSSTDPDPKFVYSADSVPGEYVATFARGAYREPTEEDEGNGVEVARAICEKHGATLSDVYAHVGSFSFESDEKTARALSHDRRVDAVESNAIVYGTGFTGGAGSTAGGG